MMGTGWATRLIVLHNSDTVFLLSSRQSRKNLAQNPAENPAQNPAENPAQNPAQNLAQGQIVRYIPKWIISMSTRELLF